MKRINAVLAMLFAVAALNAQDLLTPDDAIRTALERNYQVLTYRNLQRVSQLQNNAGNAGMSPTVSLNGSYTTANINSSQYFATGTTQDRNGAKSNGLSASINADWTVFDGLRMFAVKKRLDLSEGLSAIQLKQQMESTVYDVISAYYDIVRINQLIRAAEHNLSLYEERRKIAELRLEIGSDSKVEVLLSKSDENRSRSAIIQLQLQLLNAKANLNRLLARPIDTDFKALDTIEVNYQPALDDLRKTVSTSNSSLLAARQSELIADQSIREARAGFLPFITVSGAYVFTHTQSQVGILLSNRQHGLNFGVTGRWLLFNGGRNDRLIRERNVLALNQRYLSEDTRLQVDAQVFINYQSFLLNRKIVDMELQNLSDSREVQSISLERYRIGKANLLETIETQQNLEDAQVRFINALYAIKMAEASLLRVNGTLVK